jgi:hypothetical protein
MYLQTEDKKAQAAERKKQATTSKGSTPTGPIMKDATRPTKQYFREQLFPVMMARAEAARAAHKSDPLKTIKVPLGDLLFVFDNDSCQAMKSEELGLKHGQRLEHPANSPDINQLVEVSSCTYAPHSLHYQSMNKI